MKKRLVSSIALIAIVGLSGCGGSSSQNDVTSIDVSGKFLDSAVAGLEYSCSSGLEGLTDVFGGFTCKSGDRVVFSVNGFEIGSTNVSQIITPKTLYPENSIVMINLAQFLQTLDSDKNPDNGITIDVDNPTVMMLEANMSVDFSQNDFESVMKSYLGVDLVDETNATKHLNLTLKNIENGLGNVTKNSVVAIVQNATPEMCHRNLNAEYEGYGEYDVFINAGGSYSNEYFSSIKSCSEYEGARSCQETIVDPLVAGEGSCVLVVTFPEVQSSEGNTNDTQEQNIVPPTLKQTITVPSSNLVTMVDKNFYMQSSQESLKYVNTATSEVVWSYERVDYSESIEKVIKITPQSVIVQLRVNAKETLLYLNKSDGSVDKKIETGLLGTADITSDNTNAIVQNGWDFKLLDKSGVVLLEKSAPIYSMNATQLFLNNISTKTLSAYTFDGSLLWEDARECREMFLDESTVYCQNSEVNGSVTLSKVDAATGEVLMQKSFEQTLFELFVDEQKIYANINSWSDQGSYIQEIVAFDKNDLSESWRVSGKNALALDISNNLLYVNNIYNQLQALDALYGSVVYTTDILPYVDFRTLDEGSLVTYGVTHDGDSNYMNEYNIYSY